MGAPLLEHPARHCIESVVLFRSSHLRIVPCCGVWLFIYLFGFGFPSLFCRRIQPASGQSAVEPCTPSPPARTRNARRRAGSPPPTMQSTDAIPRREKEEEEEKERRCGVGHPTAVAIRHGHQHTGPRCVHRQTRQGARKGGARAPAAAASPVVPSSCLQQDRLMRRLIREGGRANASPGNTELRTPRLAPAYIPLPSHPAQLLPPGPSARAPAVSVSITGVIVNLRPFN